MLSGSSPKLGEVRVRVTVRKLSKRKDKEADVQYFLNEGYMPEAVIAYVMRLANPSFDDWMMSKVKAGEKINLKEFKFNIKELARGGRGPLIDMNKLNNISSEFFSYLDNEELYNVVVSWIQNTTPTPNPSPRGGERINKFISVLEKDKDYALQVFGIERKTKNGTPEKLRKDIYKLSQVESQYYYFFDELYEEKRKSLQYEKDYPFSAGMAKQLKDIFENPEDNNILKINNPFIKSTSIETWLADMKNISTYFGYDKFANFMRDLRLALTLEERTPNLYDIMQVMGKERVVGRLG